MKNNYLLLIISLIVMGFILGCTATEVNKVKDTDAAKQTAITEAVKTDVKEISQQTDEQILAKYDDGLNEAMKELDEVE